jgi:hypothetical protein
MYKKHLSEYYNDLTMKRYAYKYKGSDEVNLPLHGITTDPSKKDKVYETDIPVNHPDFEEVRKK